MSDVIKNWIEQAWSVLGAIPGVSKEVAQERLRWEEFRDVDTLEVVVFGAYDAGKSSLLKRLLVDWGVPVPKMISVSGRRETFESTRVKALGVSLTDTPGLGGGNSDHEELTLATMRLADAYLWVMPPQLVTTGKEQFLKLLFGESGIAEMTVAIVARMDEAGVDPGDNADGFAALCEKKRNELCCIVQGASDFRKIRSIHCVVADPYQMVGNLPSPDRELYDVGRSWDGMEDLARDILDLQKHHHEFRLIAGIRFVRLLLDEVRDELCRLADQLDLKRQGVNSEVGHHEIYDQRLNAMQRQARAELHRMIEDALLSVSRSGDKGVDSREMLQESLSKVISQWSEISFAEYRQLAGEVELESQNRMASPSKDGLGRFQATVDKREEIPKGSRIDLLKTGRKALAFGPALRKSFEKYAASELGMSLKTAADRLQKLELSGETVEAFIKSQGKKVTFKSVEHANRASQLVKWANVMDTLGPLVEQFGGMLFDVIGEVKTAKIAEEREKKRLELRAQLRAEAEKLEAAASSDFDATCDGLRTWLAERRSVHLSTRDDLSREISKVERAIASIDSVIEGCPV